jgi:hypothetical protein
MTNNIVPFVMTSTFWVIFYAIGFVIMLTYAYLHGLQGCSLIFVGIFWPIAALLFSLALISAAIVLIGYMTVDIAKLIIRHYEKKNPPRP